MAKSDSFFIRASVTSNGSTFVEAETDLGSFVNLGVSKSTLLRLHNIAVQYTDADAAVDAISGASALKVGWQLTTQSQSALVRATDKSLVSSNVALVFIANTSWSSSIPIIDFKVL